MWPFFYFAQCFQWVRQSDFGLSSYKSKQGKDVRMTSVEIADMVEKRHDNVKRTIESLAEQAVIQLPQIGKSKFSANTALQKVA